MRQESAESARALAAFAAQADIRRMPGAVVRTAQACLLYAVAVGIAARSAPMATMIARALELEYGKAPGPVTRMLDGRAVTTGAGAYANAVLLHGRVQEDAHPAGHVGVVVVPAALAMAQAQRVSGPDLLAAIVAGYEVALRIGRDHVSDSSARGFRSTPLYGVFGAAAAAGRLAGLDDDRMTDAICLAANFAGGLREFVTAGTDEFPLHAGMAASNGIHAVQCATAGIHAARSTLEGDAGFMRAFGEPGKAYGALRRPACASGCSPMRSASTTSLRAPPISPTPRASSTAVSSGVSSNFAKRQPGAGPAFICTRSRLTSSGCGTPDHSSVFHRRS